MKAIFKLISLSAVLLGTSCTQELPSDLNENPGDLKDVVLEVSMPDTPMTRTVLGDKEDGSYPVFWQKGDIISINGFLSSAVTADGDGNDCFAFNVKASSMSAPYTVLYPGNEDDQVVFGQEQEYVQGTFAANTLPMYAQVNSLSSEVTLDYLASVLRIPISLTSETSFKKVEVTASEGEPLSGTFSIENGTLAGVETSDKVSYTFGEDGTAFAAGEAVFHIVVPAGTYAGGLELRFYDTEGNYMTAYAFGEDKTVVAGKVYEFAVRTFFPDGKVFLISTPADMQTFTTKSGESHALLQARLTADIDMSGVEYNSDSFNFYGSLDGDGHSITGLTTTLFNNLYGSVKNLSITTDVEYTQTGESGQTSTNNPYGLGLLAHYAYAENAEEVPAGAEQVIENVTVNGSLKVSVTAVQDPYNIGGIVGASNGVPMVNCTNNAVITVENYTGKVTRVGGVAGVLQSNAGADLTECVNAGAITLNSNSISGALYLGGVSGYMTQAVTVSNCVNDAAVSVTDTPCQQFVGGMFGGKEDVAAKLFNCTNTKKGTVTVTSQTANANAIYMAGIISGCAGKGNIEGCINEGDVINSTVSTEYAEEANEIMTPAISVGGIVSRITGATLTSLTGCKNYGAITNNCSTTNASNTGIRVAGIVGYTHQPITDFSNCTNYGAISNSGTSCQRLVVGGVMGFNRATLTISSCSNQGSITNTGATSGDSKVEICMGGIIAHTYNKTTTITKCTNGVSGSSTLGIISNVGKAGAGDPGSRIGGLVGFADIDVKINASGDDRSINYGPVSDKSETANPAVGGIMAYTNNASTNLSYVLNEGEIEVSGSITKAYIGGVLGMTNKKITMNYATNAGDITVKDVTLTSCINVGGVLGLISDTNEHTYEGLTNSGDLTIGDVKFAKTVTDYSYIAGIVGSADGAKKTFKNCVNTGNIDARTSVMPMRCRVGGIAGICNRNPEGSKCFATIHFKSNYSKGGSHVGGIAGYLNVAEYKNLTFKGTVFTNGTSSTNYIGGLVGQGKNTDVTFNNCTVSGLVHGANNATGSGLFYSTDAADVAYTFTNCKVGSGSVRRFNNNTANDVVLTSIDQLTADILIGGKASGSYTHTGWSIISPDSIN